MLIHKSNIDGKIKKEKGENQELIKEIKIKYDEWIDKINLLQRSEFFIGLGSGMSWLSWAVGTHVFMINGFAYII